MPNDLENNDSIIKKIIIENDGTYDQANIGTSAEYVDYNNTSVADALDNIQQQLTSIIQQLTNNTEQITEMDETFGNARKVINKINSMQNQIGHLSQDIGDEVQKNINNTTFFTKDIIWQDNLQRTLRSILGNLVNLPLQAIDLRDWIEKISAMSGSSPGGGGGGSEPPPTIMGGNHLNAIDIQSLKISDLKNTSTIQTDYNRIICSATGGSGTYAYEVWYENATATQEISIVDGSTVGLDGQLVAILPNDWHTMLCKIWVIVTDTAGVKATKYFAFVGT